MKKKKNLWACRGASSRHAGEEEVRCVHHPILITGIITLYYHHFINDAYFDPP